MRAAQAACRAARPEAFHRVAFRPEAFPPGASRPAVFRAGTNPAAVLNEPTGINGPGVAQLRSGLEVGVTPIRLDDGRVRVEVSGEWVGGARPLRFAANFSGTEKHRFRVETGDPDACRKAGRLRIGAAGSDRGDQGDEGGDDERMRSRHGRRPVPRVGRRTSHRLATDDLIRRPDDAEAAFNSPSIPPCRVWAARGICSPSRQTV